MCVILQINRKQVNKDDSKRSNTKSAAGPFYNAGSKISGFSRKTDANSRERISDRSESSCTSNLCKEIREDRRGEAVS